MEKLLTENGYRIRGCGLHGRRAKAKVHNLEQLIFADSYLSAKRAQNKYVYYFGTIVFLGSLTDIHCPLR
jgi:hypothetical protein